MRRDARENRERILAAAEEVFGAHGATGSTEEVARLAGVGNATVFRHFPTKEALIEAALVRHLDQLTQQAQALAASADPDDAWRTLVRAMVRTGSTKLTLASALAGRDAIPDAVTSAVKRLKDVVNEVLSRAQDSRMVRSPITIDEVYLLIRGLAQASATTAPDPDTLERAIDIVLAGLSYSE